MNEERKKTGSPTQPGYRSSSGRRLRRRKPRTIIHRAALLFKNYQRPIVIVAAVIMAVIILFCGMTHKKEPATTEAIAAETVEAAETAATTQTPPTYYYFNGGDGTPVLWKEMTDAWAREAGFEKRFELTDAERWEIASVITAEAVGEPYAGKVAVAQCVLQMCEDEGIRPAEVFARYGYSRRRPDPSWESLEAVQAVFDFGQVATSEPIKYFYAPALVSGEWHETQVYVLTINGHKFFKEATDK